MNLKLKTIGSVDETSSKLLEGAQKKMGMIPNMYAGMTNNTALFESYVASYTSFREKGGFTPQEQEVIFLSVAYENNCDYCMAAHSFVGDNMTKVPTEVTDAIRNNTEIPDAKLKALSDYSRIMTTTRGLPPQEDTNMFLNAGYTEENILGVIAGIGVKTMSNYFNHFFRTEVDLAFQSRAWKKA